ncbi:MAG: hypothetical protein AB8G05_00920 [Oligoflexales bacterium]
MSCFVVSNETIDAVVMSILGGSSSNLVLALNLGENTLPRTEIDPEYDEIWPELSEIESLQELGSRLLKHNVEAYEYSHEPDKLKFLQPRDYKFNFPTNPKLKNIELLVALECYMYQIVDHEEETLHPIFKLLKEVSANMYREYVRALPEWDQCREMWR